MANHIHHGKTLFAHRLDAVTVTEVVYSPWMRVDEHRHPAPHLAYVFDGVMFESGAGDEDRVAAGTALFRPAGYLHRNRFFDAETRGLIFEIRSPSSSLARVLAGATEPLMGKSPELRSIARAIERETGASDAMSAIALEGLVLQFASALFRANEREGVPGWVSSACDAITASRRRTVDIDALARRVNVAPAAFLRGFERHVGETPAAFARRMSIENACALLARSSLALAEVAAECGFYDQAHLTRAFRSALGTTPRAYRRLHAEV